jgi:hypothetical protein
MWVAGWCLTFLAALAIPSTNLTWFDGLPFSGGIAFCAFLLILPFLLFSECRLSLDSIRQRSFAARICFWALPAGLILVKAVLLLAGAQAGWEACYRSPALPVDHFYNSFPNRTCERSYENIWALTGATRVEAAPSYRAGVTNPVFINTLRYDYYDWVPGNILRNRLPMEISWRSVNTVAATAAVSIRYVGEGSVRRGQAAYALPPSYDRPASILIPAGTDASFISIEYRFDDHARSGQDPAQWGPAGFLSLDLPLDAMPAPAGWMALGFIADAFGLAGMVLLLGMLVRTIRADWVPLGAALAAAVLVYRLPASSLIREAALISVMLGFFLWHTLRRRMHPASWFLVIVFCGLLIARVWSAGWDATALRSAGNDPLGFESQAYAILAKGNLEGGEPVFYAQPFYRYIKFLEHVCFGDGDVLYAGLQTALFLGGILSLFSGRMLGGSSIGKRMLWAGLGCVLLGLGGYSVSQLIRDGLPEYVTWTALVWAVPMLFLNTSSRKLAAGMAILALALITRTDQLPGAAAFILLAGMLAWRKHRVAAIAGWAMAVFIALLPLIHNIWFGHAPVVFTSSAGMATNLTAPLAVWLAAISGGPASQAVILDQLKPLFLVSSIPLAQVPTIAALGICAFFYLFTILEKILKKQFDSGCLLAIPLLYLIPHFFFVVQTYYPRHIVAVYLSMAVVSIVAWKLADRDRATDPLR